MAPSFGIDSDQEHREPCQFKLLSVAQHGFIRVWVPRQLAQPVFG
jgi:hypothetical protein